MARSKADDEASIGAIAPWFGSKRGMAPEIVRRLGKHRCYWDPFCGSLAVLLAKPVTSSETVNDLHGDLINLARVLKSESHATDLYGRTSRWLMHEDFLLEAAQAWKMTKDDQAPEVPDTDRAERFMAVSWFGRNGCAGTESYERSLGSKGGGFCVRYTANGGHAATRWRSCVESIPAWHRRLSGVTILNRDAFEVLARIEDAKATAIYCDPPYLVKGAEYVHDFDAEDHRRLAEALASFRLARVVVSYYEHPLLEDLYPGWQKIDCTRTKSLVNQGLRNGGGAAKAPEILLVNGPAAGPNGGLF